MFSVGMEDNSHNTPPLPPALTFFLLSFLQCSLSLTLDSVDAAFMAEHSTVTVIVSTGHHLCCNCYALKKENFFDQCYVTSNLWL